MPPTESAPPSTNLDAALTYLRDSWSVVPLHSVRDGRCTCGKHPCPNRAGKHPRITAWKQYQRRRPTQDEVRAWFDRWPDANIGGVTGSVSGRLVADTDGEKSLGLLVNLCGGRPSTREHRTARGLHFVFTTADHPIPGRWLHGADGAAVEVKGEGNYVVLPPSVHESGVRYVVENERPEALVPEELLRALEAATIGKRLTPAEARRIASGRVPRRRRHVELMRILGQKVRRGDSLEDLRNYALGWNASLVDEAGRPEPEPIRNVLERAEDAYRRWHEGPKEGETDAEPEIPRNALVGLADDFASLYGPHSEASEAFLFFAYLTLVGHVLSPKLTLASVLRPAPRLYTVLVGPSGESKKSTAIRLAVEDMSETYDGFGDRVLHGVGSGEKIAAKLDRGTGPIQPLLLVVDELATLVAKAAYEGSILLPLLSTLFESTNFDNVTKTGDVRVRDGHLSLLTATTTQKYDTVWKKDFIRMGFANRIWLAWGTAATKRISLPDEVFEHEKADFHRKVRDRLEDILTAPHPTVLHLAPDARARWDEWYMGMEKSIHTVRLDTYGWRLLMLLAVTSGEAKISEGTVGRVCALLDHQLLLRQMHDPIDAENAMAEMEQRIVNVLTKGPRNKRGLMDRTNAYRSGIWIFETALENVRRAKQVVFDRNTKLYRPLGA